MNSLNGFQIVGLIVFSMYLTLAKECHKHNYFQLEDTKQSKEVVNRFHIITIAHFYFVIGPKFKRKN